MLKLFRLNSGLNPARKPDFPPGSFSSTGTRGTWAAWFLSLGNPELVFGHMIFWKHEPFVS